MRRGLLTALVAVAAGASAAPASADVTFSGTLVTPTKLDARTTSILYYLQMRTGDREERFSVRLDPPRFATLGPFDEGQSVDGPRAIALQGEGTIGEVVQDPVFLEPCSSRDERFHGYATGSATVDLILPANTATTLAVRYRTGRRPPWRDGDYRLTFRPQSSLVGTYDATSPFAAGPTSITPVTRRTQGPVVAGRTGAHLIVSAPRRTRANRTLRVSGRLIPATARRRVILEWSRPGGSLRRLASVRTDRRGRFAARWRPPARGTFELWARYPAQPGGLTSDKTSCPVLVTAR